MSGGGVPQWTAGAATEDITPPPGIRLSGFAGRPPGGNIGVRDRLRASALYLSDGSGGAAVIVALDVIGLTPGDDARARRAIAAATGVRPDAVLIACSHTHAGPAMMPLRGTGDQENGWRRVVLERVATAARRAKDAAAPVGALRAGAADCAASINRRQRRGAGGGAGIVLGENPDGVRDPACRVLLLEGADGGAPRAALFSYAMHPVALGRTMRVSADWVGVSRDALEREWGCPALFLQGCCGDINPRCGAGGERSEECTESAGREVAAAARKAVSLAEPIRELPRITAGAAIAPLPFAPMPDADERATVEAAARATLAGSPEPGTRDVFSAYIDWARDCARAEERARRERRDTAAPVPARVSALALGPVTLIGMPGEIFTEIGLSVRAVLPGAWPLGYTNGNLGYLYPDSALDDGGYEVECAYRLYGLRSAARGTAAALVRAAERAAARARG